MVLVRKNSFAFARKLGFKCKDVYIRTTHGAQYSISDSDYDRMNKFVEDKCTVTKYR